MSTRDAFYEELERYGVDRSTIKKVEIKVERERGPTLLVYTHEKPKKPIEISEAYILRLAKLATLETPLDEVLPRDQLLKRLYGIKTIFEGMTVPFSNFLHETKKLSTKEVAEELEKLEKKYSITDQSKTYQEGLKIRILKKLTEEFGIPFRHFEEVIKEEYPTTENLLNTLATLYYY
jgi:transcriptional regulator with XRE-family HTH domain